MFWILFWIFFIGCAFFIFSMIYTYGLSLVDHPFLSLQGVGCIIGLIVIITVSYHPVKMNNYQKNLNDDYIFQEDVPWTSLKIKKKENNLNSYNLVFTSYDNNIMNPTDYLQLRHKKQTIKFKKGTKNCIHYQKEVNVFGDVSDYADNIIIEYKDR